MITTKHGSDTPKWTRWQERHYADCRIFESGGFWYFEEPYGLRPESHAFDTEKQARRFVEKWWKENKR